MHLEFTTEEKVTLVDVLENYLSDMRMEIADTDKLDFRETLKQKKEILKNILEKLKKDT